MIVCIFENVQWRWALNDRLALGYGRNGRRGLVQGYDAERGRYKLVVALSLCTTVHSFYTKFAKILCTSISETTVRPNPRYKLVVPGRERSLSVRLDRCRLESRAYPIVTFQYSSTTLSQFSYHIQ
jgi:hypothetical protein